MKVNQIKAGAILSYISMGISNVISLVYTPIMLRLLGQSEYGLYNLAASIVSYLGILNFGFGSAYVHYYSIYRVKNEKKSIAQLNGMFLIIFTVIGAIAIFAGMILILFIEEIIGSKLSSLEISKARILMMIMIANLAISFPSIVFSSYITANEQFVFQRILHMIKSIISPFFVLPVLLMGYGSVGLVVTSTVLSILYEIANIIFSFRKLEMRFSFIGINFSLLKEMIVYSFFIFINLVTNEINWNTDKYLLGRFHGTVPVAIYGIASNLNSYYLSFSTAISNVFTPRVHKMVADKSNNKELTLLFTKVGRVQFIIMSLILTGIIFYGKPFINIWAGSNYDKSYYITLCLVIPVTIPLIQNIGIEIQRAKNMHQFRSWTYLFIALLNIFISIPFTKAYEGVGAALGTAISLFIGNGLIMNWYYQKKVGIDIVYFWKNIFKFLPALIPPSIFGIIVNQHFYLYDIKYLLLWIFVYVLVFAISMWFIGMNHYEKDLIKKPFEAMLKKITHKKENNIWDSYE